MPPDGSTSRLTPHASRPRRILIVRLSALGDIVHALPLAENARRAGAEVGWVVERGYVGLLEGNSAITRPNCSFALPEAGV